MRLKPSQPNSNWMSTLLEPSLIEAPPYKIDTPQVDIKLDQNESPWDWPEAIKGKIIDRLMRMSWNRYPGAFSDDLADKIAHYAGVESGSILLGPGSNYLVSLALSVFSKGGKLGLCPGKVVIARPSFALYESHCRYEGIAYEPWLLDEQLEYAEHNLPELPSGSVVIFASPNNPVGNALSYERFAALLTKYPDTLWIADEAYFEYTERPYTELLGKHSNLMLIRTFSKTMGCAGVRIGYVLAHPDWLSPLKKLRLPYLLNHFSVATAEILLDDAATQEHLLLIQRNAIAQRQLLYAELKKISQVANFYVKPSEANFLLLRWPSNHEAIKVYQQLVAAGILVRNVMAAPGLAGCLRITVGSESENAAVIEAMRLIANS